MAKGKDHTPTGSAALNPEQLTKEIEGFLSQRQAAISHSIDQLLLHKKEIDRKAEEDKRAIDDQIEKLNDLYYKATNRYYLSSRKAAPEGAGAGGKRERRSKQALEAEARAIFEFVQSKGKDGVRGGEI